MRSSYFAVLLVPSLAWVGIVQLQRVLPPLLPSPLPHCVTVLLLITVGRGLIIGCSSTHGCRLGSLARLRCLRWLQAVLLGFLEPGHPLRSLDLLAVSEAAVWSPALVSRTAEQRRPTHASAAPLTRGLRGRVPRTGRGSAADRFRTMHPAARTAQLRSEARQHHPQSELALSQSSVVVVVVTLRSACASVVRSRGVACLGVRMCWMPTHSGT